MEIGIAKSTFYASAKQRGVEQAAHGVYVEDRSIEIWAYNLETVLAEKPETVVSRATTNTRMRDFYDLHILSQLHGRSIHPHRFSCGAHCNG